MIEIREETPDQPEVRALLAAGDDYVAGLYPPESNHMLDVAALKGSDVTFQVARSNGKAVGCGAVVRCAEGWAEIKRMFVAPQVRGRKLGRRLLERLKVIALQRGATLLRLETGIRQPEALALYRSAGFTETGPFGAYRPDPLSIFLEKKIGRDDVPTL
jgi:putative acetyltransferase